MKDLTLDQRLTTLHLQEVLETATRQGVLDRLLPYAANPDSINDFCDALKGLLNDAAHQNFLRLRPIILRWEGDDELWLLGTRQLIGTARNSRFTKGDGIGDQIALVEINTDFERAVVEALGQVYDGSAPSTYEVFDYIQANLGVVREFGGKSLADFYRDTEGG
jgi:hypothetical protein